jgi:hypothetical protein
LRALAQPRAIHVDQGILRYPSSLVAGSYTVAVSGVNRSLAKLVVVPPAAYSPVKLIYPWGTGPHPIYDTYIPRSVRYDAERRALLVTFEYSGNSAGNEFVRYSYASGNWGPAERHGLTNLYDGILSTDGATWLAAIGSPMSIRHYDTQTLTAGISTAINVASSGFSRSYMAMSNDGEALVVAGEPPDGAQFYRYRIRSPKVYGLSIGNLPVVTYKGAIGGSADGSTFILGNGFVGNTGSDYEFFKYSASDHTIAKATLSSPIPLLTSAPHWTDMLLASCSTILSCTIRLSTNSANCRRLRSQWRSKGTERVLTRSIVPEKCVRLT